MSRLARWSANILTALSLLIFAAAVTLWVRSRHTSDVVILWDAGGTITLNTERGDAALSLSNSAAPTGGWLHLSRPAAPRPYWRDWPLGTSVLERLGFAQRDESTPAGLIVLIPELRSRGVTVPGPFVRRQHVAPLWPLCLATITLPLVRWLGLPATRRLRRRCRRAAGLCPTCRYDLRVTPGRCPECGWAAEAGGK